MLDIVLGIFLTPVEVLVLKCVVAVLVLSEICDVFVSAMDIEVFEDCCGFVVESG